MRISGVCYELFEPRGKPLGPRRSRPTSWVGIRSDGLKKLSWIKGRRRESASMIPFWPSSAGQEGLVGRVTDVNVACRQSHAYSGFSELRRRNGSKHERRRRRSRRQQQSRSLIKIFGSQQSRSKLETWWSRRGSAAFSRKEFPIGWFAEIGLDQRQLFLQAQLHPAVQANQLRWVLILVKREEPPE